MISGPSSGNWNYPNWPQAPQWNNSGYNTTWPLNAPHMPPSAAKNGGDYNYPSSTAPPGYDFNDSALRGDNFAHSGKFKSCIRWCTSLVIVGDFHQAYGQMVVWHLLQDNSYPS